MKYKPETEGVDHFNAYSQSETVLGRLLSNWADCSFVELSDGWFNTLEGYWFWLKTGDNEFRYLSGWEAKQRAKDLGVNGDLPDEDREKFKKAIWTKLEAKKDVVKKHYNDLPIVHYYNFGGKIIPAGPEWYVDYLNEAVPQIKDLPDEDTTL